MLFGCLRQNRNHSSENLKVIYIKCSMCYAIINYQFKTSELKNVEKLVKQTVQALKSYQNRLECAFLYNLWNYIPSRLSLKSPWKMVTLFVVWSLYWGRAGQLLANFSLVPSNNPRILCESLLAPVFLTFLKWRTCLWTLDFVDDRVSILGKSVS